MLQQHGFLPLHMSLLIFGLVKPEYLMEPLQRRLMLKDFAILLRENSFSHPNTLFLHGFHLKVKMHL
ncbi:hypothetical protein VO68_17710 [Aeromonas salmonicida]|nr:hypothetical protein VO68_17710 [Aeromonas salmonicida]